MDCKEGVSSRLLPDASDKQGEVKQSTSSSRDVSKSNTHLLPMLTVAGVAGGVIFGLALRLSKRWSPREIMYVQFPGDVFLRMLKALILPLLFSSITSAVGSLDLTLSKRIAGRAVLYYSVTTVLAVLEGIVLVLLVKPGKGSFIEKETARPQTYVSTADTLLDLVRNMFPPNLVQSCLAQYKTVLTPPAETNTTVDIKVWKMESVYTNNANVLGIVVFAVTLGTAIGRMGNAGKPLLAFLTALGQSMMLITSWILWLSPVGVFFLIAAKMIEVESFSELVGQLGLYFLTVLSGLLIHGFLVLPLIFFVTTRKIPIRFLANMSQAVLTAFATSSSSASLSVSMSCLEEKNNIDARVTRFVMPIGATVNMDGAALYEAVAVIFISQVRKMSLSIGQIFAIGVSATLASIGTASIPQAGLVTLVMVLDTVGLPAGDVSLILAVDWLLDRFRTSVNVIGDSLGAGIVYHLSRNQLQTY